MKSHYVNDLNNFIGGWYISEDLCDRIIEKVKTRTDTLTDIQKEYPNVERNYFYTTFFEMSELFLSKEYFSSLHEVLLEYRKKYEDSNKVEPYRIGNDYKIQYYKPNNYYSLSHCENAGSYNIRGWRHLVFMTYLNDVSDGGETEFFHQKIKVKPEKGLTLIWPSQWTHTHRGCKTQSEKYILTGWYYFQNEMTNQVTTWY